MAKHKHKQKNKQKNKHRNGSGSGSSAGGHSSSGHRNDGGRSGSVARPRRRVRRADKPSFWTAASAIAGGVGGAALGGWAARQGYDPRWVGAALAGVGGLGAWKLDGGLRLASYGVAAAGAGASVLEFLDKDEDKPSKVTKDAAKAKDPPSREAGSEPVAMAATGGGANGMRQARAGAGGLDRAFNKVRERLHRIYEDDDDEARVDADLG